jgi:hypothetical protein
MSSHEEFVQSVLEDTKRKLKDYEAKVRNLEGLQLNAYGEYKLMAYKEKIEATKIHIEVLQEELEKFKNRDLSV